MNDRDAMRMSKAEQAAHDFIQPLDPAAIEALHKAATPTPARPFDPETRNTAPQLHNEEFDEGDAQSQVTEIMKVQGVDPLTAHRLARLPVSDSRKVGSYISDGAVFVYVDCLTIDEAYSRTTKDLAYAYRFTIGMGPAGIEAWGSPYLLDANESPPSLFPSAGQNVYRTTFKLQNPV